MATAAPQGQTDLSTQTRPISKMSRTLRSQTAVTLWLAAAQITPALADPAKAPPTNCWRALESLPKPRFVCEHQAWMTDDEKADVVKLTRGYLKDARCTVKVDIDSALVSEALVANNKVVDLPPQPVSCRLETYGGPMTITGTFAPHVEIQDGMAVKATPGLANVVGVNKYLAWPVVAYVNNAPGITKEMARMINTYRATRGAK